jgi:hypothetical protein
MYNFIKSLIMAGGYRLEAMEKTIERHYVRGDITDEQKVELLNLAAENADESKEIDIVAVLADLESRIEVLESAGVAVWKSGMSTKKGQTVLYDIINEGRLRYCRYDGGRDATALSPGKIEGWVILSGAGGEVTHTVEKDENGNIILVPVVTEDGE